jgi:hypothetical protein
MLNQAIADLSDQGHGKFFCLLFHLVLTREFGAAVLVKGAVGYYPQRRGHNWSFSAA